MRLGFMGTPEFSVKTLKALIDTGYDVAVVYTQPPRPKGRGKKITPCPVHSYAETQGIEVLNPINFKDSQSIETLKSYNLDALVVVAYGIILPQIVLNVPKYGCYNGHASLLPRWRGAAPIQRAIEAGDNETGVCIMKMDAGLDTGDVLTTHKVKITRDMNAGQLHDILAELTSKMITSALGSVKDDSAICTPQPEEGTTYAEKLLKSESLINWGDTAENIYNRVRAFTPFPSSTAMFGENKVKVLKVRADVTNTGKDVGTVVRVNPLTIACGEGTIIVDTLQKSGKKPVSSKEFLNGHGIEIGQKIG